MWSPALSKKSSLSKIPGMLSPAVMLAFSSISSIGLKTRLPASPVSDDIDFMPEN
jgi:hypothetical protein